VFIKLKYFIVKGLLLPPVFTGRMFKVWLKRFIDWLRELIYNSYYVYVDLNRNFHLVFK